MKFKYKTIIIIELIEKHSPRLVDGKLVWQYRYEDLPITYHCREQEARERFYKISSSFEPFTGIKQVTFIKYESYSLWDKIVKFFKSKTSKAKWKN